MRTQGTKTIVFNSVLDAVNWMFFVSKIEIAIDYFNYSLISVLNKPWFDKNWSTFSYFWRIHGSSEPISLASYLPQLSMSLLCCQSRMEVLLASLFASHLLALLTHSYALISEQIDNYHPSNHQSTQLWNRQLRECYTQFASSLYGWFAVSAKLEPQCIGLNLSTL